MVIDVWMGTEDQLCFWNRELQEESTKALQGRHENREGD